MKNFSLLTASQRKDLAEQQVLLGRLGVTADQTGKIMDHAMKTYGMSMEEAKGVQLELAGAARDLGIPTGEMMESFASAMPDLAKFGKAGKKEFLRLQVIAKRLKS